MQKEIKKAVGAVDSACFYRCSDLLNQAKVINQVLKFHNVSRIV